MLDANEHTQGFAHLYHGCSLRGYLQSCSTPLTYILSLFHANGTTGLGKDECKVTVRLWCLVRFLNVVSVTCHGIRCFDDHCTAC